MFDLTGRVAVITGGSKGLGRGDALALARQGADIVILARGKEALESTAAEVRALGRKCLPIVCDITHLDQIKNAVAETIKEFGKVDILINNAGGGACMPLEEMTDEAYMHNINLELVALFQCTREFGKEMLKNGYGRVINISSILGMVGLDEAPCCGYQSSKGGVINFTRSAAVEWAKKGITVNAVCPGFFPSAACTDEQFESMMDMIRRNTPIGRAGVSCTTPDTSSELDSTIVFLAADESSYVTGAVIPCDGGWTCH